MGNMERLIGFVLTNEAMKTVISVTGKEGNKVIFRK